MKVKFFSILVGIFALVFMAIYLLNGPSKNEVILLATTTSTQDSGLLDFILPEFEKASGFDVKVVAVGTGQALQMGRDGEADVLLVHAKEDELIFVQEGHGLERYDVMYNDFILVGPEIIESKSIMTVFKIIMEEERTFVSRGDDSGTHKKEKEMWKAAGLTPDGAWYLSTGKGMGDVLQMTNEVRGYTLTDRATYLSMKESLKLEIAFEGDRVMHNTYGVIAVNPEKNTQVNYSGAHDFINWILSTQTQELIATYGKEAFGQALFFPNAK